MKRLLCLDGGGILGYLSARILAELEKQLPPPPEAAPGGNRLLGHFDLIAGTSTGSILAAGIASGMPLSAIVDLYRERGRHIFKTGLALAADRATRVFTSGISHPKHSDHGLAAELRAAFGERRLGELRRPTLVPAFDASQHQPIVFKSRDPDDADDLSLPLWEVVKCSCSAPSYFPSHTLEYTRGGARRRSALVDGGLFANNPTMCALAELFSGKLDRAGERDRDALVISVGTSQARFDGIGVERGRRMGLAEWALPMVDVFMGGAGLHVHGLAYRILEHPPHRSVYVRFEILTPKALAIDRAEPEDFARLDALLDAYFAGFPDDPQTEALHRQNWYDYSGNLQRVLRSFRDG